MSPVAGVAALNLLFLALGYALLWGLRARPGALDAGLALLLGTGVTVALVFLATIAGARANLRTLALAAAVVLLAAAAARGLRLPRAPLRRDPPDTASIMLAAVLAGVAVLAVVGGFRSSPWLDDAWGIWLPKGIALLHHGLDERLFAPPSEYVAFEVPDYPLWWSVLGALDVRAVGSVDLRALNAQLGLLAVAYAATVPRLLWGHVRPWAAVGAGALVAFSPEFFRHAQGGAADLPLGIYVSLAALCGALWLRGRHPFHLVLATLFAAVAVQVKTEGLAEVACVLAVGLVAARRRLPLVLAGAGVLAAALPWLVWQRVHDVPARTPLDRALDPSFLAERADRVLPAAEVLVGRMLDPSDWLVIVPLLLALAIAAAVRERRPGPLAPLAPPALMTLFLVYAYTVNGDELEFLLRTSAYRVVDPVVLTAAALLPLSLERLAPR